MSDETPAELVAAELDDSKPTGTDLVIPADADEHEVFVVLDRNDELAIVEEMQRRSLKSMLYQFPMDGSDVVDLNVTGVLETIDVMNRTGKCRLGVVNDPAALKVEEVTEEHTQEGDADIPPVFVQATVWARDAVTDRVHPGIAVQPKFFKPARGKRKGKVTWDRFAITKAVNKAERNALKKFIPEPLRQTLIAQFLKQPEMVKQIAAGAGAEELATLPPPLEDEDAKRLVERARDLWMQVREANPVLRPPGWFHEGLLRSQHSHEALLGFCERLEELLKVAKGAES